MQYFVLWFVYLGQTFVSSDRFFIRGENMNFLSNRLAIFSLCMLISVTAFAGVDNRAAVFKQGFPELVRQDKTLSVDAASGRPTFLWATPRPPLAVLGKMTPDQRSHFAARAHMKEYAPLYGLGERSLETAIITGIHQDTRGPVVVRFQQFLHDIPVANASSRLIMNRDSRLVAIADALAPEAAFGDIEESADFPRQPPAKLLQDAIPTLLGPGVTLDSSSASFAKIPRALARWVTPTGLQQAEVRGWKVYYLRQNRLIAGLHLEVFPEAASSPATAYILAASDYRILEQFRLDNRASYRVYANPSSQHPLPSPHGLSGLPHPTGIPDESQPPRVGSSLISLDHGPISTGDPWLPPVASQSAGNNTRAYTDLDMPDGFTGGTDDHFAPASSSNTFNYIYDFGVPPSASIENQNAGLVHAFYVVNYLHDWFYDRGFRETDGNAQLNNFGRGGAGNDPILIETLDFEDRNNANISVPADGASPRMQLFVFDGDTEHNLTVTSPASLAGGRQTGRASFGPKNFSGNGNLVLVNDGVVAAGEEGASVNDGCEEPFVNAAEVVGNIALIDRGFCFFIEKAAHAEAAGASALVVVNNVDGGVITMGVPEDNTTVINIPVLMISKADGNAIKSALASGNVQISYERTTEADKDSSLDTMLIAHEWGHYLVNRLVFIGDADTYVQSNGLDEGWSDFVALLFSAPEDPGGLYEGAYAMAHYAPPGEHKFYYGFRRLPYSRDFEKNALTFRHIANGESLPAVPTAFGLDGSNNAEVHATGEVWASMLWEAYTELLTDNGRLTFEEARQRMQNYLVSSLKATPARPDFVEARDALLAVAQASDSRDYQLFIEAFARRGLGAGAVAPDKTNPDNAPVVESFVAEAGVPPAVFAGNDQNVDEGDTVVLSGSSSGDPAGTEFTYQWTQVSGPAVTLTSPNSRSTEFVAPQVNTLTLLSFELTVTNKINLSARDNTDVTVRNNSTAPAGGGSGGGGGGGGGVATGALLLTLLVAGRIRRRLNRT